MTEAQTEKYRQAAITYFVYGLIYLIGAIIIAQSGISSKTARPDSGLIYFITGGLFVILIPLAIWKGFKWFTRIIAIFIVYRLYEIGRLVFRDGDKLVPVTDTFAITYFQGGIVFLVIAAFTGYMLARAGWDL